MPFNVELPHVGESVTEAVIGKWLKKVGDRVEKYDPLVEVVTDKVSMEVPAPAGGTLTRIIADEGDTVEMGAVIAEMEGEGAASTSTPSPLEGEGRGEGAGRTAGTTDTAAKDHPDPHTEPPLPSPLPQGERGQDPTPDRIGTMITGANVGPTGGAFLDTSLSSSAARRAQSTSTASADTSRSHVYSPLVTRLAAQHGVDLSALTGTGLGGRITKNDVLAAVEGRSTTAVPPPAPAPAEDRVTEPTPVRRMIAAHMAKSWAEIPHAWSAIEVDVTGLVQCRAANREAVRAQHGVDLTYLPLTLHAVSRALRANPLLNSSWENGKIRLKGHVNVGIAVAAKDGLVVPVVRDADSQSVIGLARRLSELIGRAREGRLGLDDVRGGTFTLNNTGALGSVLGGAIINHPEAAILTTEAIVERPVVVSTPMGDAVGVRCMMNICLSFDHRVIDGAEASAFLQDVRSRLEAITPETPLE